MPGQRARRKATFYPQAILIVLPLVILALVGVWSLRQDRLLAEQDARDRARQLTHDLLPRLAAGIVGLRSGVLPSAPAESQHTNATPSFEVSPAGQLLSPIPIADPLPKPLDPALFSPELARLWQDARGAEYFAGAADAAIATYRQLLEHGLPDDFTAAARISVAVLEARQGRPREAIEQLRAVMDRHPDTPLESGLPANLIAALKLLEVARADTTDHEMPDGWVDAICSNAVQRPTWVTQPLLDAASAITVDSRRRQVDPWHALWRQHVTARRLYVDARGHFLPVRIVTGTGLMSDPQFAGTGLVSSDPTGSAIPRSFWFSSGEADWLALTEATETGCRVDCIPEVAVAHAIENLRHDTGNVPLYFEVSVTVADRRYRAAPNRLSGRWEPTAALDSSSVSRSPLPSQPSAGTPKTPNGEPITAGMALASHSSWDPLLGELTVEVHLADPTLFFARQRSRTYWFAALIAVSAAAASVGLVTGWRAFHRQLRLAEIQSGFVSSVSHELRAPIASIRLLAESLEGGRVRSPEKQAEYFTLMGQECRRLTALIGNVLDFSRIDQGRKQYEFEPTDVVALVRQTVRLMEPQAAERQVTLTVHLQYPSHPRSNASPECAGALAQSQTGQTHDAQAASRSVMDCGAVAPLCEAATHSTGMVKHGPNVSQSSDVQSPDAGLHILDGRALQQALVNLIDNAVKHAPPNSTVEIGLAFEPTVHPTAPASSAMGAPSGGALRIWVLDSGEGIPLSEQDKIFEPFYRRGTELRRETAGIGIGLSIVKHIAEAHRGRVTVDSIPGRGSTFTLHLP